MGRRERRRATTAGLAASLLVHVVLLAWLAASVAPQLFAPAPDNAPDIRLDLSPPPAPIAPEPRPRPAPAQPPRRSRPAPTPQVAAAPLRRRPAPVAPAPPRPAPAPALRRDAPTAPAPAPARPRPATPWSVRPDDGGEGDVRDVLRATVGCSHQDYLNLTAPERAACDRRLGRDGREAQERLDALPAEARAAFDQAVAARDRMRATMHGPIGEPVAACQSEGSGPEHGCLNLPERRPQP